MRVPVTLVCVLLMLPIDAGPAEACRGPALRIWADAGVQTSFREPFRKYEYLYLQAFYGDSVNVYCFGSHDREFNLNTINNVTGFMQPFEIVNVTTVMQTLKRPEIGKYLFNCTDLETTCEKLLTVAVIPTFSVISRSVRQRSIIIHNNLRVFVFFVPISEHYEVFCSGNRAASLIILKDGNAVETYIVNQTTIKTKKLQETVNTDYYYECRYLTPSNESMINNMIGIQVDHAPTATNFSCVEYIDAMKCYWSALSVVDTTFTLFYADVGNSVRLCENHSSKIKKNCEFNFFDLWKNNLELKENITLIMMACNMFFCENQTFHINRLSIMKSVSPSDLKVLSTSSHSAVIRWRVDINSESVDVPLEHKILYRLPGINFRELNASSLRGDCIKQQHDYVDFVECEKALKLPCSNTLYDVKVFAKLTTTPQTKAYWSDPAAITFYTDAQDDSTDANDPVCDTESDLVNNPERALYETEKLARQFRKEGSALRKKVDALKLKRAKIEAIKKKLGL